ncbi:MAG: hypothetical protein ACOX1P_20925 [Thermoguttaceae bacterium]|jgi:hypothetical protein
MLLVSRKAVQQIIIKGADRDHCGAARWRHVIPMVEQKRAEIQETQP